MNARHDYECNACGHAWEDKVGRKTCPECKSRNIDIVWHKAPQVALSPHGVGWPDVNRRGGLDY